MSTESSYQCQHVTNDKYKNDDEKVSLIRLDKHEDEERNEIYKIDEKDNNNIIEILAGLAGNIIEWYDFAIFGFFSDVIGDNFFPPNQDENAAIIESFLVFGSAFLMRPFGALIFGYIGDKYGAKKSLELSLFLMAFPTFTIGCLPTYNQVGYLSIVLLSIMRLLQGLSVGGQLISSVVFTLEKRDKSEWGLYGSYVMISLEVGTLLGSLSGYILRTILTEDQVRRWGWRIPFLLGIALCIPGYYLKYHSTDMTSMQDGKKVKNDINPIREAFKFKNIRFLLSSTLVAMLGTSSFYLTFVWMAIFFHNLVNPPIQNAFLITTLSLFLSLVIFTPIPGILSDKYHSRIKIMIPGAVGIIFLGPLTIYIASSTSNAIATFISQCLLGISICFWGAPMAAWMVESFPKEIRLTTVSIGYNIATSSVGGFCPAFATIMVDHIGIMSPAILYIIFPILSLIGLYITPKINYDT